MSSAGGGGGSSSHLLGCFFLGFWAMFGISMPMEEWSQKK